MQIFALIEKHFYPEVDGGNEVRGLYASKEKAEKELERIKPEVERYLGSEVSDVANTYELVIEEFELEL